MNLIPVKDFPPSEPAGLPTKNTCYKWHSLKKHPALLLKVGSRLFFDLKEWQRMAEAAREQQVKEAHRIKAEAQDA